MRRRVVEEKGFDRYVIETFESFDELLKVCDSRPVKSACDDETRKCRNDKEFMGCENYNEAVELLKYGYTKNIETVKASIKKLEKQGTISKVSFRNDIVGYAPIVPNAIIGVPQSMINNVRVPKKSKVVTLVIDMAVSARTSKEQVLEYGNKVVQKIIQLEQNGFRVRIEYMKCFNSQSNHAACCTVIKNENQPLDLKRIMFPLTHVSMQRYISWDWYDRVPDAYWDCLRGKSLSVLKGIQRKEIIDVIVSDTNNKYVICFGDDLEEILKQVR